VSPISPAARIAASWSKKNAPQAIRSPLTLATNQYSKSKSRPLAPWPRQCPCWMKERSSSASKSSISTRSSCQASFRCSNWRRTAGHPCEVSASGHPSGARTIASG
jgi:hypothetical protein